MSNIVNQPFNNYVDDAHAYFMSNERFDCFTEKGVERVFSDAAYREQYINTITQGISEESDRKVIVDQINHSLVGYTRGALGAFFSNEGFTHDTQPGNNAGLLDFTVPATIIGYNAKCVMLDVYKSITHDKNEYPISFEISYVISSDDEDLSNAMVLPQSIRNGKLKGALNAEKVTLLTEGAVPSGAEVEKVGDIGFAKLGKTGNAIKYSGKDRRDWALNEDIKIGRIHYDASVAKDGSKMTTMIVNARSERKMFGGDVVSERFVQVNVHLAIDGGTSENDYFMFIIDKDTGDYKSTPCTTGRIHSYEIAVEFLNAKNLSSTLHHGRRVFSDRFVAKPRTTMEFPLTFAGIMDEFQSQSAGSNDLVKYVSDEFSKVLAGVNDNDMDEQLVTEINLSIVDKAHMMSYIASPRLQGFAEQESIDITVRGVGGERPFSWIEEGIKDTTISLLNMAESYTQFDASIGGKSFVMTGYINDVRRFVDNSYFSSADDNNGSDSTKYGFLKHFVCAFSDNFGRRVKFIGSADERFLNRQGLGPGQVYGFLRSETVDRQPTAVYFGYSFRVLKSTAVRTPTIQAVSYWVSDFKGICAMVGVRINLQNPRNAYPQIAANSKMLIK